MSQRTNYRCSASPANANFAGLRGGFRASDAKYALLAVKTEAVEGVNGSQGQRSGKPDAEGAAGIKKAVRNAERPKSREETPKLGNDCGEACQRNRKSKDELLRLASQSSPSSHMGINKLMYRRRNKLHYTATTGAGIERFKVNRSDHFGIL